MYVGDNSGYVYNSRDTGKTWTSEQIADLPIRSIFPYTGPTVGGSLVLYALTPYSLFIKNFYSTSWEEGPPLGYFYGLGSGAFNGEFSKNGTAFIVGVEGDFVAQSTIIRLRLPDSHWYSVGPENEFGELYGLSIPSSNIIYTCGSNGKILKSTNEGDYWVFLNTPTSHSLNSIYFIDNKRGFAVGDSGTILYTSSGGISLTNNPPSAFHLLKPVNEDSMLVMRSIGFEWQEAIDPDNDAVHYTLLISGDTGKTWKAYGPITDTTKLQVHSPAQTPGRYFWTVIANDAMFATPSSDVFVFTIYSVSNVDNPDDKVPGTFMLLQNYPNPFNPSTTFSYIIPNASKVIIKIYDLLGNEIETLVNDDKGAGNYEVKWNAVDLPSGVYFYQLRTGSFIETKKMLLLK